MKLAVCVKRVPDMEARFRLAAGGTAIDETGLKYDLNEFDAWAVEAALRLKEKHGAGEVVIISLGPDSVQETIRKAVSMGADRGVHLQVKQIPFDPLAIATALAAELKDGGYDLILFGKMAPDSSNAAVGPMTAELLGLPCVTGISGLEMRDGGGNPTATLSAEIQDVGSPEQTLLGTNRAAMMWNWSNALEAMSKASGRDLVLLRPPGETEHARTGLFLNPAMHYSISARTEHPEEAALFLDFLLNDDEAVDAIGSDRGLPVNLEQRGRIAADLNEYQTIEAEFLADIAPDVVDAPPAPPVGAGEFVNIIKRVNVEVLFDRMNPQEGAERLISEVNAAIG
jgi:hypothetical protein